MANTIALALTAAGNASFKNKVKAATVFKAKDVWMEAQPDGANPLILSRWQKRQNLARVVLTNSLTYENAFLYWCATYSTLAEGDNDAAFFAAVLAGWDQISGVTKEEQDAN